MNSFDRSPVSLTRREFLGQGTMTLSSAALTQGRAFVQSGESEFVEVKTQYGRVRGIKSGGLATFRGIPYAGSVSGANRFKAAPPLEPWTGVRDALKLGHPAGCLIAVMPAR